MAKWTMALLTERALQRMGVDVPGDLAALEIEDLLGVIKRRVRVRGTDRIARDRGKPAFDRKPRFGFPAMPTRSRMTSRSGERTIHFAINKGLGRSAAAFDRYATEKEKRRKREKENTRESDAASAATLDTYAAGHGGEGGTVASVRTNLVPDPVERGLQWDRLEEHERRQGLTNVDERRKGMDRINLRVDLAPEFAGVVARHPGCPERLHATIADELERAGEGHRYEGRKAMGAPFVDADAKATHMWIRNLPEWQALGPDARRAFKFSGGRAVQTHVAFELELPNEFDELAYETIEAKLFNHLASLGRAEGDDPRLCVAVALARHRVDRLNDPRNGHLHGLLSTRRAMLGADGRLIEDENGNVVFDSHKVQAITAREFPKSLRTTVTGFINIELERLGAGFRVSPESYAALKIDADPQRKLGGEDTVLSRAGIATLGEQENVLEAWHRKFAEAAADYQRELACKQAELRRRNQRIDDRGLSEDDWDRLRIWSQTAQQKEKEAAQLRHEERQIRLLMEMAVSRPELVARFAPAYAEKAAKRSRYDRDGWLVREADAIEYRRSLGEELDVEERAREQRRLDALMLDEAARRIIADIDGELAREHERSVDRSVPILETEPAAEKTLSSADVSTMVEAIRTTPLRLIKFDGLLKVDARDDPDQSYATALFDSPALQTRLAAIQKTRDVMPGPLTVGNAAHSDEDAEQLAPRYIAELARVWRLTRPDHGASGDTRALTATDSRAALPAPVAGQPADTVTTAVDATAPIPPRLSAKEVGRLAEQAGSASHQRARAMFDKELRQLIRPNGSLGEVALAFLTELGARPEHYRQESGQLVCAYRGSGRATGFELLMRDDEVRHLAENLHAHVSGDRRADVPIWLLQRVDQQRHDVTIGWIRQASAPADRLMHRLPELLSAKPLLARAVDGIGYADESFVTAAGADALGIMSRKAQLALEAAYRLQEAEREECLGMVASGRVRVTHTFHRTPEFGTTLRAVTDDPLPALFTPFVHDAAFARACVTAARSGEPKPQRHHYCVRAWLQARDDGQPVEVLGAIAAALWKEPRLKEIFVDVGGDLAFEIAKTNGRAHELGWMFPRKKRGRAGQGAGQGWG